MGYYIVCSSMCTTELTRENACESERTLQTQPAEPHIAFSQVIELSLKGPVFIFFKLLEVQLLLLDQAFCFGLFNLKPR